MLENIETYIILFFCYSIFGWIFEVLVGLAFEKKFVNRGFLIGPYCPIYGCGGLLITLLLEQFTIQPIAFFVLATVICAFLEYITSYVMEKIFHVRWWDYSDMKFNINGRVCLEALVVFGVLGIFEVYVFNPVTISIIKSIPFEIINIVLIVVVLLFIIDNIISWKIISNIKIISSEITDSTEVITKKVKQVLVIKYKDAKRIIDAFPGMKFNRTKIKEKINERLKRQ